MYKGLHVKYGTCYSCQISTQLEFPRQIFEKYSYIKFNESASSGSRVSPWGRKNRRTEMTKLIVAFRSFAKAPDKMKENFLN